MDQRITTLATCKQFRGYCYSLVNGNHIYEDLVNDVILILNDTELKDGGIDGLARVIAWREVNKGWSNFNVSCGRLNTIEITNEFDLEDEREPDVDYFAIIRNIDEELKQAGRTDIKHEIFKKYLELETIREVSRYFDISKSTVARLINDYKLIIKSKIQINETTY